jgi:hypothetical protein
MEEGFGKETKRRAMMVYLSDCRGDATGADHRGNTNTTSDRDASHALLAMPIAV